MYFGICKYMVANVIDAGQIVGSGWQVITNDGFDNPGQLVKNFLEGALLTGFAGEERYTQGRDIDEYVSAKAAQNIGEQVGTIAWDVVGMSLGQRFAPLRYLFAAGNVVEGVKQAMNGDFVDAGQQFLTAGLQVVGLRGIKQVPGKLNQIAKANPKLGNAARTVSTAGQARVKAANQLNRLQKVKVDDVIKNMNAKRRKAKKPVLTQQQTESFRKSYLQRVRNAKRRQINNIRNADTNINNNLGILQNEAKQELVTRSAPVVQNAGKGWQWLANNFNQGMTAFQNQPTIILPA